MQTAEFSLTGLVSASLSDPVHKDTDTRVRIRSLDPDGNRYQIERFRDNKAYHENMNAHELAARFAELFPLVFRQAVCTFIDHDIHARSSKKGTVTVKRTERKESTACLVETLSHNRQKKYLLPEGIPLPFLRELGVCAADGKIIAAKYDKFRQINRFLEFIEDISGELAAIVRETGGKELTIVDFGCGKSYLTFAAYWYLHEQKGLPVTIVGLDLKEDVIERCNTLALSCGYRKLFFEVGDIAGYRGLDKADMVISLHACDTATDFALAQAIAWKARVIMAVPCCQHELNGLLAEHNAPPPLEAAFRHGLIRERMAALLTDSLRASLLEQAGYRVQILEFIDMSHTPKNVLIRAVRGPVRQGAKREYEDLSAFLGHKLTLERSLASKAHN